MFYDKQREQKNEGGKERHRRDKKRRKKKKKEKNSNLKEVHSTESKTSFSFREDLSSDKEIFRDL